MKKTVAIILLIAGIAGLGVYFFSGSERNESGTTDTEASKSELQRRESIDGEVLDIPGESTHNDASRTDSGEDDYADPDEHSEDAGKTQMERFEKSMAADSEVATLPEDLPTAVPEEAPAETPYLEEHSEAEDQ